MGKGKDFVQKYIREQATEILKGYVNTSSGSSNSTQIGTISDDRSQVTLPDGTSGDLLLSGDPVIADSVVRINSNNFFAINQLPFVLANEGAFKAFVIVEVNKTTKKVKVRKPGEAAIAGNNYYEIPFDIGLTTDAASTVVAKFTPNGKHLVMISLKKDLPIDEDGRTLTVIDKYKDNVTAPPPLFPGKTFTAYDLEASHRYLVNYAIYKNVKFSVVSQVRKFTYSALLVGTRSLYSRILDQVEQPPRPTMSDSLTIQTGFSSDSTQPLPPVNPITDHDGVFCNGHEDNKGCVTKHFEKHFDLTFSKDDLILQDEINANGAEGKLKLDGVVVISNDAAGEPTIYVVGDYEATKYSYLIFNLTFAGVRTAETEFCHLRPRFGLFLCESEGTCHTTTTAGYSWAFTRNNSLINYNNHLPFPYWFNVYPTDTSRIMTLSTCYAGKSQNDSTNIPLTMVSGTAIRVNTFSQESHITDSDCMPTFFNGDDSCTGGCLPCANRKTGCAYFSNGGALSCGPDVPSNCFTSDWAGQNGQRLVIAPFDCVWNPISPSGCNECQQEFASFCSNLCGQENHVYHRQCQFGVYCVKNVEYDWGVFLWEIRTDTISNLSQNKSTTLNGVVAGTTNGGSENNIYNDYNSPHQPITTGVCSWFQQVLTVNGSTTIIADPTGDLERIRILSGFKDPKTGATAGIGMIRDTNDQYNGPTSMSLFFVGSPWLDPVLTDPNYSDNQVVYLNPVTTVGEELDDLPFTYTDKLIFNEQLPRFPEVVFIDADSSYEWGSLIETTRNDEAVSAVRKFKFNPETTVVSSKGTVYDKILLPNTGVADTSLRSA